MAVHEDAKTGFLGRNTRFSLVQCNLALHPLGHQPVRQREFAQLPTAMHALAGSLAGVPCTALGLPLRVSDAYGFDASLRLATDVAVQGGGVAMQCRGRGGFRGRDGGPAGVAPWA